jgi:signal transduction histidine kinase/ActR/RegA family two-component response regulator
MSDVGQLSFLRGGGHMGALMRAHDWTTSSLGPPAAWPQALRTAVRIMLNTGHPMYVFWGPELACLYNDAYSESIGPERHPTSLGRPGRDVWEEIWGIIGPQIDQVMAGRGATWHVNHLVPITRHGQREDVYWTYSYSPIDDETAAAGVGGVLVVCTETTAEVLTARRLASERDRLAQLFEQAPTFMALLRGPEHRYERGNPAYLQLVGHRPILGRTVAEALPEALEQGYVALLDRVFESGEAYTATGAKIQLAVPSGLWVDRYVDFVYQPLKDDEGRVTGIFVLGADVTERTIAEVALRRSEAELRDADRRKDEFLAMLAHELRNPLAPIRTGLELIRLAGNTPAAVERVRSTMERQVGHMVRLIDDLLDVSRIVAGKIRLQREHARLDALVAHAIEAHRATMTARKINLRLELPEDPIELDVDPTRFSQVLSNLLHNATKFTPAGGTIRISACVTEAAGASRQLALRVADSGIGISPELLPRVFDLFTQGAGISGEPGLGVGLALVRRLVQLHGGEIAARSDGPGLGSEFEIVLPLSAAADVSDPTPADTAERLHRRVVVIDDNEDAANTMAMLIESLGGEPRVAHDGERGIREVLAHRPDVVLLDIGMQHMDGYETCRRIRQHVGDDVMVVALTGWGQDQDKEKAAASGFDAHLTKPADPVALKRLLARRPSSERLSNRATAGLTDRIEPDS